MRNFESALGGLGGCPMTGYELLGNLDTLNLLQWCKKQGIETGIKNEILDEAISLAAEIFQ
jgi:hydroxymethylglutaryl-CoA lyase